MSIMYQGKINNLLLFFFCSVIFFHFSFPFPSDFFLSLLIFVLDFFFPFISFFFISLSDIKFSSYRCISVCGHRLYEILSYIGDYTVLLYMELLLYAPENRANSLCGYFLCGDHCKEITTAQENHNGCGEV
jgi:hypothetical protein